MFLRSTASAIPLSVHEVVLIGLHEWLHELPWDQLHIVALLAQSSTEKVGSGASFEPNQRSLQVSRVRQQLLLRELPLHQHLAGCPQRHEVKGRLAQVDANGMNLHDDPPENLPSTVLCNSKGSKRRTISLVAFSEVIPPKSQPASMIDNRGRLSTGCTRAHSRGFSLHVPCPTSLPIRRCLGPAAVLLAGFLSAFPPLTAAAQILARPTSPKTVQPAPGVQSGAQSGVQPGAQSGVQSGVQPGIQPGVQPPPATISPLTPSSPGTPYSIQSLVRTPTLSPGQLALLELEGRFAQDVATGGGKAFSTWFAEDAVTLNNGRPALQGRGNIAAGATWSPKDYQLSWIPQGAQMGPSNDMGFTWGSYEGRAKDKNGGPVLTSGRYITIWRKQPDGTWKVAMDASANDAPASGTCCTLPKP